MWSQAVTAVWSQAATAVWSQAGTDLWYQAVTALWSQAVTALWSKYVTPLWSQNVTALCYQAVTALCSQAVTALWAQAITYLCSQAVRAYLELELEGPEFLNVVVVRPHHKISDCAQIGISVRKQKIPYILNLMIFFYVFPPYYSHFCPIFARFLEPKC